jgi:hypothetical protein
MGWISRPMAAAAVAGMVSAAVLAGGVQAQASSYPAGGAAGDLSTVAGGVGGPAIAAKVAIGEPADATMSGGTLYVAAGSAVRAVSESTTT